MPKRKRESCERLERRIKKLQKRIRKYKDNSDSDSESSTTGEPVTAVPSPEPAEIIDEDKTEESGGDTASVEKLDDTILAALGSTQDTDKVYGEEVHKEIVKRVEGILVNGLKKESIEEILKKYNVPKNATLLDAPKLNVELQGLLSEQIKARDKKVEERQQLLGVSLAAVMTLTHNLISNKENNPESLKSITVLTDVSRLLAEVHFQETAIRRKLIGPSLDQKIAKSLENVKRDEHLYEKFGENIKTANAIKKSATTILKPGQNNTKKSKKENFRAPPRNSQFRQGRGGGRYQQRGSQRANHTYKPKQQPQKSSYQKKCVPQS